MSLINLADFLGLGVGWGPYTVRLSEDTLDLIGCSLALLDDRDEWDVNGEELDDDQWDFANDYLAWAFDELLTEVAVGGEVYVDRGDPSAWDVSTAGFTKDGAWHTLSLESFITDVTATRVLLVGLCKDTLLGRGMAFAASNETNLYNVLAMQTQAVSTYNYLNGEVFLPAGRSIKYSISSGMDEAYLLVRGWWKPAE